MSDLSGERFDRLRLVRSPNVGPVSYRQLIARFGSAASALEALPEIAARGGRKGLKPADARLVEREASLVSRLGARYLIEGDADYPALLDQAESAPPVLIARGNSALASAQIVAMVGARNASAAACRFARGLAHDLAGRGIVIASGLARGIDTAAHNGARPERTIAVIGCGIDVVFPPENAALQDAIASEGLLLTELPPGAEPLARHFPARNRIIAWMSAGAVVVEAAPRSGSLLTARLAGEEGREVMAVPGSPLDQRAIGCNLLIRDGATLIQNADDVIEAVGRIDTRMLRQERRAFVPQPPADLGEKERRVIVSLLGPSAAPIDEVVRLSGLPPALVQVALVELELAGRLGRHAGGKVSLAG